MNGLAHLGHTTQQPHKNTKSRFIHFSQNTEGRCGRPVFIDAQLLPDFLSAVDIANYKGLQVVKQIEQLRALGGGIHSHQNKDIASQHKCLFGETEVHYYISQVSIGSLGGIYITKVNSTIDGKSGESGLYSVRGKEALVHESNFFNQEQACIGAAPSVEELIKKASIHTPESKWGKQSFDLFFAPDYDIDKYGTWITPTQKTFNSLASAEELANILQRTQKSLVDTNGKFVKIRIFDSASTILDKSLNLIKGHMDKLGFEFIDPDVTVTSTITKLTTKNASLSQSPVKITSRSALIKLTKVRNQLSDVLRNSGKGANAQDVLKKTQHSSSALSVSSMLGQHKSNFLAAARQANLLGKWQG